MRMGVGVGLKGTEHNARQMLEALLRSDGNTVGHYRADKGITGSLAASAWANQLGAAPSLTQGTTAAQPLNLAYNGDRYFWGSGVAGNSISTPSAAANQITGDIALVFVGAMDAWGSASRQDMIGKWEAANAYLLGIVNGASTPDISWVTSGGVSKQVICSANNGFSAGSGGGLAVTLEVATGTVKFWKTTATGEPSALTWSQLGNTDTSVGATSIKSTAAAVRVNGRDSISGQWSGKTYRAQIYNGIPAFLGGSASNSPVVDLNPARFAETTNNGATAVMSTGETWTIANTGAKVAQIVGSSQLLLDGTNSYMGPISFTLNQPAIVYGVIKPITWTNIDQFWDGATADSMVCIQQTSSPNVDLYAGTLLAAQVAFPLNTTSIIRAAYNGASSGLGRNATAATTGNAGSATPGGFTLGRQGTNPLRYGNFQCKEIIIRKVADAPAKQLLFAQLLNAIHSVY